MSEYHQIDGEDETDLRSPRKNVWSNLSVRDAPNLLSVGGRKSSTTISSKIFLTFALRFAKPIVLAWAARWAEMKRIREPAKEREMATAPLFPRRPPKSPAVTFPFEIPARLRQCKLKVTAKQHTINKTVTRSSDEDREVDSRAQTVLLDENVRTFDPRSLHRLCSFTLNNVFVPVSCV